MCANDLPNSIFSWYCEVWPLLTAMEMLLLLLVNHQLPGRNLVTRIGS